MISKATQEKLIEMHFGIPFIEEIETKELKASDRLYKKGTSMSVGDAIVWSLIENELARRKQ
tara:strand:- start:1419 stop:1604 length:186 start_codon:yes stop_codon:yes gene_type:complete